MSMSNVAFALKVSTISNEECCIFRSLIVLKLHKFPRDITRLHVSNCVSAFTQTIKRADYSEGYDRCLYYTIKHP